MSRILRVITRLNIGGPSVHVRVLDRGLRGRGHEVLLARGPGVAAEGTDDRYDGPTCLLPRLRRAGSPVDDFRTVGELLTLIREFRPDILHSHQARAGGAARLAAVLHRGVPVVHTFHGTVFEGHFGPLGSALARRLEACLAAVSSILVVQSPRQADQVRTALGAGAGRRIVIIPPAVDIAELDRVALPRDEVRRGLGLRDEDFALGWIGRMAPVKQVELLPELLEALRELRPVAVVAGDGPGRDDLIRRTSAGAASIRWLGFRRDIGAILRGLDAVVMTSKSEGTPLTLIEAQCAGCPVAAFDVGGVRDVVHPELARHLAPAGATGALAFAVREIAARRWGSGDAAEVSRWARVRFDPERLASDMEALYAGLVRRG